MSDFPGRRGRNPLRHLGLLAAVAAVILVASFVTLTVLSEQKHALVVRTWETGQGSLEHLMKRHPNRAANASALRVEELSAAIGIDAAPRWADERPRPTPAERAVFRAVWPAVSLYLERQIERADASIEAPPAELKTFLEDHGEALDALRTQLVAAEAPRWEFELQPDDLAATSLPNLLGHINLQKLLLADALARCESGDTADALESLEAAWRLGSAIRDDPILITQLIAIAGARMQAGVLRKLDRAPGVWRERLAALDYRGSFLDAMRMEGWFWLNLAQREPMGLVRGPIDGSSAFDAALGWLARPYVRACAADVAAEWHRQLARLSNLDVFCDRDLSGDLELSTAWWNYLGEGVLGGIPDSPSRLARLEVDLELTAAILEARAGTHPAPGQVRSRACPEDRWIYTASTDGELTVELSRPIVWPDPSGPILPTRFTIGPG